MYTVLIVNTWNMNRNFSLEKVEDHNEKKWIIVRLDATSMKKVREHYILTVKAFIKTYDEDFEAFDLMVENCCDLTDQSAATFKLLEIEEDFFSTDSYYAFERDVTFCFEVSKEVGNLLDFFTQFFYSWS
jgi:hypothetical protein